MLELFLFYCCPEVECKRSKYDHLVNEIILTVRQRHERQVMNG